MMKKNPKTQWNQSSLHAYRQTMDQGRIAVDRLKLSRLFDYAGRVPEAKKALQWAQQHNIEFHIDHECRGCSGYYLNGMGVVSLSTEILEDPIRSVEVLTHEIRHAWQDDQRLLVNDGDGAFIQNVIETSLIEADAYAHGSLARLQAQALLAGDTTFDMLYDQQVQNDYLWSRFQNWYNLDYKTSFYCEYVTKKHGQGLGLQHLTLPVANIEIKEVPITSHSKDLSTIENVLPLGTRFHDPHVSYLKGSQKSVRDFLAKKALTPLWAMTAFTDPQSPPNALMQRVRIVEKRVARMSQNTP